MNSNELAKREATVLDRAIGAAEILVSRFGLDPIYIEALRVQSGEPWERLFQQREAMADLLAAVAEATKLGEKQSGGRKG